MIGFISTSFPTHPGDPAGSFVLGLARTLVRRGHAVEVVVPEPPEPARWGRSSHWLEGIRVFPAPYARPRRLQRLFFRAGAPDNLAAAPWLGLLAPAAMAGLAWVARRRAREWDGVISHWLVPSALVGGWTRSPGCRHLAIAHSGDVHLITRSRLRRHLATAVMASADHLGFVSGQLRREFLSVLPPHHAERLRGMSSVTPMGVDPEALAATGDREQLRTQWGLDKWTVLFIGRLVPIKGVDVLIDAVAHLKPLTLVIAGDGPLREELEHRARARGIDVRFCGFVDPVTRAALLRACDLVVLPSRTMGNGRHEGLPLTLVEALAAKKPVVASDTGGIGELIHHGDNGWLVPPADPCALRRALELLSGDRDCCSKLAEKGSQSAQKRSWESLGSLYERLLGLH